MRSPYPMTPIARLQESPPMPARSYHVFRTSDDAIAWCKKHNRKVTGMRKCPVSGRYIVNHKGIIRDRVRSTTTRVIMSQGIMLQS